MTDPLRVTEALNDAYERLVAAWHELPPAAVQSTPLCDFMGLSWEQYARWVEDPMAYVASLPHLVPKPEGELERCEECGRAEGFLHHWDCAWGNTPVKARPKPEGVKGEQTWTISVCTHPGCDGWQASHFADAFEMWHNHDGERFDFEPVEVVRAATEPIKPATHCVKCGEPLGRPIRSCVNPSCTLSGGGPD